MSRAFELRANVTAYDACYVALAEALDWPLCTVDRRLAHASGPRCTMQLITHPGAERWTRIRTQSGTPSDIRPTASTTLGQPQRSPVNDPRPAQFTGRPRRWVLSVSQRVRQAAMPEASISYPLRY